jgi:hypothetical protein
VQAFGIERKRGYIQLSRAWFGKESLEGKSQIVEEIAIGLITHDNPPLAKEFMIQWHRLLGGRVVAELSAFEDSWDTLAQVSDLLGKMARLAEQLDEGGPILPEDICAMLNECGIEDLTPQEASPA